MNKLCNKCKYREVFDFLGTNFVSCSYEPRSRYDKREAVNGVCNKFELDNKFIPCVCDMCKHFVSGDCLFISCDFTPCIDNILDLPGVLCSK